MTEPRTAQADDHPCELYAHTSAPIPSRTQHHHRRPVYLQERLYDGQVRYPADLWLCGLCHDSTHDVLGWLLGESRKPSPMPGRKTVAEAKRTYDWYLKASAERN